MEKSNKLSPEERLIQWTKILFGIYGLVILTLIYLK